MSTANILFRGSISDAWVAADNKQISEHYVDIMEARIADPDSKHIGLDYEFVIERAGNLVMIY